MNVFSYSQTRKPRLIIMTRLPYGQNPLNYASVVNSSKYVLKVGHIWVYCWPIMLYSIGAEVFWKTTITEIALWLTELSKCITQTKIKNSKKLKFFEFFWVDSSSSLYMKFDLNQYLKLDHETQIFQAFSSFFSLKCVPVLLIHEYFE